MRKLFATLCISVLLVGCSGESKYQGKWGTSSNSIELLKDHTAVIHEDFDMPGTWKLDDSGGLLVQASMFGINAIMRGRIEGDKLVLNIGGTEKAFKRN